MWDQARALLAVLGRFGKRDGSFMGTEKETGVSSDLKAKEEVEWTYTLGQRGGI